MRIPLHNTRKGFTRRDLILVLVCLCLLAVACAIAPIWQKASQTSRRTACVNNLKELGTSLQMYLHDREDRFPWAIATQDGGSRGLPDVSSHFLALTSYITSPKHVSCPGLKPHRPPVQAWAQLKEKNVGYGLGVHPPVIRQIEAHQGLVGGFGFMLTDMDIEGGEETFCAGCQTTVRSYRPTTGIDSVAHIRWSKTNHVSVGQVSLVDGTTVAVDVSGLRRQLSLSDGTHILMPK